MEPARLLVRLLDVIENDILPLTTVGVCQGNKIFGAAILRKDDLSLVLAETNNETENPLWHGEIHAIKRFHETPAAGRPSAADCLFLATHEPCSLCLSGITWSGFDNFHYLFSHADSRDAFAIPHDIRILREVYAVPEPGTDGVSPLRPLYNRSNAFFQSHDISEAIDRSADDERSALVERRRAISERYAVLSRSYQRDKGGRGIPLD